MRRLLSIVIEDVRISALLQEQTDHSGSVIKLCVKAGVVQGRLPRAILLVNIGPVSHAELHAHQRIRLRPSRALVQRRHLIHVLHIYVDAQLVQNG